MHVISCSDQVVEGLKRERLKAGGNSETPNFYPKLG